MSSPGMKCVLARIRIFLPATRPAGRRGGKGDCNWGVPRTGERRLSWFLGVGDWRRFRGRCSR
jgi:hypothetical protein